MAEESRGERVVERGPESLADRRRRVALELLIERDGAVAVAEAVAARESASAAVEPGGGVVRSVYLSLYHRHVPKLADAGVVEFDPDRSTVAVSEGGEWIEGVVSLAAGGGR